MHGLAQQIDNQSLGGWDKNSLRGKPMDRPPPQKTGNQDNENEKREELAWDRSIREGKTEKEDKIGGNKENDEDEKQNEQEMDWG